MKRYVSKRYLIEQLKAKSYIQIAKENEVDDSTIQRHMRKYRLTKKRVSWTKLEIKTLKEGYTTPQETYKKFPNRTISSVNHKASRLGLKKQVWSGRKYKVDHDFFKEWTPEMSYVLGFFFSDGNVHYKKKVAQIRLHKKDHYILEKISRVMGSDRPVSKYPNSSQMRINSKILCDDIIRLGCVPRKSLILGFPQIKKGYLPHFIRGYFDGDGSIRFNKPNTIKISFVGTKKFISKMQISLNKEFNLRSYPIRRDRTFWTCHYYGDEARKLCRIMYKDTKGLYLKRKRDRFEQHIIKRNGRL